MTGRSSYAEKLAKLRLVPHIHNNLQVELAQPLGANKPGYIYMFRHTEPSQGMLVKIGKTDNVQRRMNEWQNQCGYNLELVRYYPYVPKSPMRDPSGHQPQMVPYVSKVERLIHLELAEKRIKRLCRPCGREHREWFEVESTRQAIQAIDHTIRRWCEWSQSLVSMLAHGRHRVN